MDIDQMCRICMQNEQDMSSIFQDAGGDGIDIAKMLSSITKYKVQRNDEMPHNICNACSAATISAFHFKLKCEQSYRTLANMLQAKCSSIPVNANGDQEYSACTDKSTQTCSDILASSEYSNENVASKISRDDSNTDQKVVDVRGQIAADIQQNRCNMCDREFTRREHMRRHLAVIHKIIEDDSTIRPFREEIKNEEKYEENSECNGTELSEDYIKNDQTCSIMPVTNSMESNDEDTIISNSQSYQETNNSQIDADITETNVLEEHGFPKEFIKVLLDENETDHLEGVEDEELNEEFVEGVEETVRRTDNRILTESPTNKCKFCDKIFQHRKTLQRHLTSHEKQNEYYCKMCMKRFRNVGNLEQHLDNYHNGSSDIKCEECSKVFAHQTQLKRHIESKHGEIVFKCEICEKGFSTKVYLQRHERTHEKKRYNCKECAQSYLTRKELNTHIKAEGHDKPMLCPECGLRCKTKNILMVHIRRHKGEKPFKCKFCSKGFPRMDDLRVHEKYHTNEKSHFCETCGKGFQRKYNLTIHLRVHTGERPYKCPHCPQAFAQGNDLKAHIRRHTGERFRCEICSAAFLQGYQIRQHKLQEHGIKEIPPTQRVAKFTSPEEQEQQIKQNLQRELTQEHPHPLTEQQSWTNR